MCNTKEYRDDHQDGCYPDSLDYRLTNTEKVLVWFIGLLVLGLYGLYMMVLDAFK